MKLNRFLLLGTLLLLCVGLILGGCAKKDNPFNPDSNFGTTINEGNLMGGVTFVSPGVGGQLVDLNATTPDVQGQIVLTFPQYLNASTINFTNISLDMQPTTGGIAYYPELKRVVITGTWTNSAAGTWHKLTIKPGLLSVAGKPIDGNGNGKADGSPYDDYVTYFYTGGAYPVDPAPDLVHPKLVDYGPKGGYQSVTGNNPLLYFDFDSQDVDTNLVKANVTLKDSAGVTKQVKSLGSFWTGTAYRVRFCPTAPDSPLVNDRSYTWSLNINAVQDTHNNKATWLNYGYIASLPTVSTTFRTIGTGGDFIPLHFSVGSVSAGYELTLSFDDSLDYSTFNTNTVKVYNGSIGAITGQIYGRVYYLPSDVGNHQIRFTMENGVSGSGNYVVWLSRYLKDNNGLYLDGNNNGIGGEAGHPEWPGGGANWNNKSDDQFLTFTL